MYINKLNKTTITMEQKTSDRPPADTLVRARSATIRSSVIPVVAPHESELIGRGTRGRMSQGRMRLRPQLDESDDTVAPAVSAISVL